MAESIFVVDFKVESEAYQALSELKANPVNDSYTASSAFVVKNENGQIQKFRNCRYLICFFFNCQFT